MQAIIIYCPKHIFSWSLLICLYTNLADTIKYVTHSVVQMTEIEYNAIVLHQSIKTELVVDNTLAFLKSLAMAA